MSVIIKIGLQPLISLAARLKAYMYSDGTSLNVDFCQSKLL